MAGSGFTAGCDVADNPDQEAPYFKPGEYGGSPIDSTEHLYNLELSPDGRKIALIRSYSPDNRLQDPKDQLWIVNADGTDPQLIAFNIWTVDWSPDGDKLAVTFEEYFGSTYTVILNLITDEIQVLTGLNRHKLDKQTANNPQWFSDGDRLLVSVWGGAYKQSYERGVYILDIANEEVQGPLVEFASAAHLGNNDRYFTSIKYEVQSHPLSGNYITYRFDNKQWEWITDFSDDSLSRWVRAPFPNPTNDTLIFSKYAENAWQLFAMDAAGTNHKRITSLGGSNPQWGPDGDRVLFKRDVHKGEGARFVPHYYVPSTGEVEALWPHLPDSVPAFPPVDEQDFMDILARIP